MAQTRKNGKRAVAKLGNSGPKVTLKKRGRCSGGGVKKIGRKHSVKRKRKSSNGKKTVKRAQCGGRLDLVRVLNNTPLNNTFKRQARGLIDPKSKRNTLLGKVKKFSTGLLQVGRTPGQYVTRGNFPDLIYTNNLVRAIALRVGLTPEMIEVFGARAKSGVPKTIFKMRTKKPELFQEFINLGTLQEIPSDVSQESNNLSNAAAETAADAEAETEAEAAAAAETAATAAETAAETADVEGGVEDPGSTVGGGIPRKILDYTFLKPWQSLMRQTAVDLVNTNNLVRLIAYQLGMSPDMISEIAGYHNDPEGKRGFPKTYYKDKNKVFKELFDKLPRVEDSKGPINIPVDPLDITNSVSNA